ncbi:hypothetical protein X777_04587 [Ooceraea biroi]|uniref:Uncharacterized protein n=1 Tax=Ooceraea biroi TaxID=2015173 RepID=A0A026X448_OOCBI|nr:hypothetical protein X777_04587 [Ooceraea biroi]
MIEVNAIKKASEAEKKEGRKVGNQVRIQDACDSRKEATTLARTSERFSPALVTRSIGAESGRALVLSRTRAVHSLRAETKICLNERRGAMRWTRVGNTSGKREDGEMCTR